MKSRETKKNSRIIIVIMVLVIVVVGYYCYLINRDRENVAAQELTAVQEVLVKDLSKDYPPSPREVIKYYNEIMKCFYNEECSVEEIEELGRKARELYDEDLLAINTWENYIANLNMEILQYKELNRRIASASLASSIDVDEFSQDGYDFARIRCGYTFTQGKGTESAIQVYLLRRDENRHWKIYGWDSAENVYVN